MPRVTLQSLFSPTVLLALALMTVIIMMILPMPAWILDIGLAGSFSLAILIFTVTLFIERPLDFSAFPTILLASLMLRLSLNVSSTKLIIGQGHTGPDAAGGVIEGFAAFIMGGSVFLGLVVFGVLLIVNFMVITKGAARMAEVGARFALDGMPGKQLAIDSDMSAGAIDHAEAKRRRTMEQQETTFFGSLDGASKFVKGDAIAGLLITLLNLVMGLAMGIVVHDMPIGAAFETYAILTVGDGLVTQIPAVVISIASALLLARGGNQGATDIAVFDQLGKYPAALSTVAVLMVIFALVPGLPFLPFIVGGVILGLAARAISRRNQAAEAAEEAKAEATPAQAKPMGDILDLDDIHVEFAPDLVAMVLDPGTGLDTRIANMRRHVATSYGIILPEIRLTDQPALDVGTYRVRIQGVEQATGALNPDMVLALLPDNPDALPPGHDVTEPVYGAPARWIAPTRQDEAAMSGATIVTPPEILATHLLEVIKSNFSRLLTLKALRRLLTELTRLSDPARSEANRKLIDELIPDKVPMDTLHAVLRLLVDEQVSIRNLPLILESISEARLTVTQPEGICELVRQRLGFQLVADLKRPDGTIPLLQLAPEWEEAFAAHQVDTGSGGIDIALPPEQFNRLAGNLGERLNEISSRGITAALVTPVRRRRFLRTVMQAHGLSAPVLSFEEIGLEAKPSLVGVVAA
ncbi:flagellar biosynthesis protein FlhA [Marinibacterium profundimaris]|uniref:Flagellar biosynthesis protein FlhA n=1 Tax=Marinibacterium profundimaris TaxID=1679460 RepID=A0A225NMY4_9RHOB|nr:flagellar biosynthesis protein FlhA [Marinibacterium profundimaris]OWU75851.1 flagellar biosynthesis protein FlhA [Marinibacterium profundimaris]